jgi:predicted CxxxxCH...CXXCH cytochrome family protein
MRALAPAAIVLVALLGACADPQPVTTAVPGGGGGCTSCHGDATRAATVANPLLPAAPPVAPSGKPASVVGAHQAHLNDGAIRSAIACANCHTIPGDAAHAAGGQPPVVFAAGQLATTQNAAPTYDGTALTCSSTYCHGKFTFGGVSGNTAPTAAWNSTAAIGCTGCHGMPPTGHPALTGTVTPASCNACHPATVKADGSIDVAGGKHIDGLAEFQGGHSDPNWADPTHHGYQANAAGLQTCTSCHVAFGPASGAANSSCNQCHSAGSTAWQTNCTFCHGTAGRTGTLAGTDARLPASPPVGTQGETAGTTVAVGAHQGHVNPASASAVSTPWSCTTCHPSPLPSDVAHVNGQPTPIQFSGMATTGSVTPVYNRGAAPTCSSTYCHGNFRFGAVTGNATPTPAWTNGAALGCTGCHGMPPTGHPALTGTVTAVTCNGCHPATVKADGTIDLAGGKHLDGLAEFQGGHTDPSWIDPTHHGYQASAAGLQTCTSCHVAFGTASGAAGSSCNQCHSGGTTAWQTNCTFCHGTAGRTANSGTAVAQLAAAPPVGTQGETAATTVSVGAHQGHVNPATATAVSASLACITCHPSPLPADVAHVNGQATPVQFSGLATSGGATPVYNRGASPTCSSTYCHGAFSFNGVSGNTTPTPAWTNVAVLACTGCHGMPPTGHPALTGTVTAVTCNACHPATVRTDGTIDLAGGKHLNGASDVAGGHPAGFSAPTVHGYQASAAGLQTCTGCHVGFGPASGIATSSCNTCHGGTGWQTNCTFCHGTAGRTASSGTAVAQLAAAPPVGTQGEAAATAVAVGAHMAHVNPPATGALSTAFACTACHPSPLPADVAHVNGQATPVQFGQVGTVAIGGTYNRTASPTCSSTYCHGNFTGGATANAPAWTAASVACNSCHAIAPSTGDHGRSPHVSAGCGACHSGYTSTAVNPALHVNGTKNVGGTGTQINSWNAGTRSCGPSCHGNETW